MTEEKKQLKASNLIQGVSASVTLKLSAMAREMKGEGKKVWSFTAGEPDFPTPEYICEAAHQAIRDGKTVYTPASGIAELKEAVCGKFRRDQDLSFDPSQIVVTSGAKQALYELMASVLNHGDVAMIPTPYWVSTPEQIKLVGGVPCEVPIADREGLILSRKDLENAYQEHCKLLVINSPNNPTGAVIPEENLKEIGAFCLEKGIFVISDEIYERIIFGENRHVSILQVCPELKDQAAIVNGVSKTYAMTGWRIGYLAAPKAFAQGVNKMQSHLSSNASSIAQYAALAAVSGDESPEGKAFLEDMRDQFEDRSRFMVKLLNEMPGISCASPGGTFYCFPNVEGAMKAKGLRSSEEFCQNILESANVVMVPGEAFGAPGFVRISCAVSKETIEEGLGELQKAL